ncbi:MAG: family 16 glycoside hydrolase, partial [bacterium]
MRIISTLVFLQLSLSAWAVEIIDLPEELAASYDISCKINVAAQPKAPVIMTAEKGYALYISAVKAEMQHDGVSVNSAVINLKTGDNSFSIKRRPGTIALLVNHRLAFYSPMPEKSAGKVAITSVPAGVTIANARYYDIAAPVFGDDFMRPDVLTRMTNTGAWIEDDLWKVDFYKKENPGTAPTDPATTKPMANPWMLSLYPVVDTTTNAFWFVYRGVGPSWATVRDNLAYPTWDSYYVETSVRPEFDSVVGIIAGYQDNKNYLLFRMKQRNYTDANVAGLCELIAVSDGVEKVIASSNKGFDPNQWYKIRINFGLKIVQAVIDGQVVLEAQNTAPAEGGIGLYGNGSENPHKIQVDDVTADMYKIKDDTTGKIINDAADALRKSSVIYFDDVKVGEWEDIPDALNDSPYKIDTDGKKNAKTGIIKLANAGKLLTGAENMSDYEQNITAKTSNGSKASMTVLFNITNPDAITGYAWTLSAKGQRLSTYSNGKITADVATSTDGITPGEWQALKVAVSGEYIVLSVNGVKYIEYYNKNNTAGRCGIMAMSSGVEVKSLSISKLPPPQYNTVDIHAGFETDKWMATWSSPEADWYPVDIPAVLLTPAGFDHFRAGSAAPLPTDVPGLYWYKGSIYHDFKVKIPVSAASVDGQTIYLSSGQNEKSGYSIDLAKTETGGTATLNK